MKYSEQIKYGIAACSGLVLGIVIYQLIPGIAITVQAIGFIAIAAYGYIRYYRPYRREKLKSKKSNERI